FTKTLLITFALIQVVNTIKRLRGLLVIQTLAVLSVAVVSLYLNTKMGSRITGALQGIFGNPNDLATNIVLVFPFAVAFLLLARNPLTKIFWFASLPVMVYALIGTYSRGGFLGFVTVMLASMLFLK